MDEIERISIPGTILARLSTIRRVADQAKTVDVVGLGIDLPGDLTLATMAVLVSARRIFCVEPPGFTHEAFAQLGLASENIGFVFDRHPDREEALAAAAAIVADASEVEPGVVFALGGHPTTAVLPLLYLRTEARRRGLSLVVHPSVSSFDAMLCDLVLDPTEDGFQLIRGRGADRLSPSLPAAILCPGYARSITFADRLAETSVLASRLAGTYGADCRFLLYSRLGGQMVLKNVAVAEVAVLADRPRLGDLLLVGPVHLLPPAMEFLDRNLHGISCTKTSGMTSPGQDYLANSQDGVHLF